MSALPTTGQKRARHAWETVEEASRKLNNGKWGDFDGHVMALGPRILIAGLGPALAFLNEKQEDDHLLLHSLAHWVLHKGDSKSGPADLLESIRNGDSDHLRRWTAESLEWLAWVKRFCAAETNKRKRQNGTENAA
ncbi:MAG: type III-B CRISPR module-associated protein Cmr5 [Acetobacteraceae bacterium]